MIYDPTSVKDHEVQRLVSTLERYPTGIIRDSLEKLTGLTERRARDVGEYCRARSIAPVVCIDSKIHGGKVYKLAQSREEYDEYLRRESRKLASLQASIDGLTWLRDYGPKQTQDALFEPAGVA